MSSIGVIMNITSRTKKFDEQLDAISHQSIEPSEIIVINYNNTLEVKNNSEKKDYYNRH